MTDHGKYVLAQGPHGERRLGALHSIWGGGMISISQRAGLQAGMKLADFGCGAGHALASFAEYLGPEGHVTGIDISSHQLEVARLRLERIGARNFQLIESRAENIPVDDHSFDFVYSRYLLIHLTDPPAAIREMLRVLKPGGVLFIDDADLTSCFSSPPSAADEFARIFAALGTHRGVDYTLGRKLHSLMLDAGIEALELSIEQPGYMRGDEKRVVAWSIEETRPAVVSCGLHTPKEIDAIIEAMHRAVDDDTILMVVPRMTRAWGRKPARAQSE
jgi:ubiquinone/menaquinone biosynthesis C-methylase UbiE